MKLQIADCRLLIGGVVIAACALLVYAQTPEIDAHVAAAKAAVGTDHELLFTSLCSPAPSGPGTRADGAGAGGQRGAATAAPAPPSREQWHAAPMKVFDNLYFLGMTEYSAWAVNTSEGIIIIDALFDYSVDDEVAEGLKTLGLDPAKIKYVMISHGHGDHSGGAKFLQDSYKARVLLSAADWDLLERSRGTRPARDMVVTDGQKLTLGDTTITIYNTPGHTAGTLSYLIPVKDNGTPHLVAEWGGTAFNFPRTVDNFRTYTASAVRFGEIATRAGADVLISNHSQYDGSKSKLPARKLRKSGDPNPYVVGNDSVRRYMKIAEECSRAAELRVAK
jgi:metallo-beta-lactamase class B